MADSMQSNRLVQALALEAPMPVAVAYSGGVDSTVLLHALACLPAQRAAGLRALHVNHGLHESADAWANHCTRFCAGLGVPLRSTRVTVDRSAGQGLEAAARSARYAALAAELQPGEVLATAHHLDDQAETFLLRALRASGPEGLSAMQPWREFGRGAHWRPLLALPRGALRAYASARGLEWIEDPANALDCHDRNFLRLHVMPLLRQRWSHADAALARSGALCAEASGLLLPEDAHALATAATPDPTVLRVAPLRELPRARLARVLRAWVTQLQLPALPANGVQRIADDLLGMHSDTRAKFAWGGSVIHRWRDVVHAGIARPALAPDWRAQWDGREPLPLPSGGTLSLHPAAAWPGSVIVHARRGGERITLPGRIHSHSLKHVLQDQDVPPWRRARLPLLSDQEGVLLAAGDWIRSARFDAWLHANGARLEWRDTD